VQGLTWQRSSFFCIDEPVGYQKLRLYWIHPFIRGFIKVPISNIIEWRSRWTGTGDEINLPTEINRRHLSQKKVKAMFCAAVWL